MGKYDLFSDHQNAHFLFGVSKSLVLIVSPSIGFGLELWTCGYRGRRRKVSRAIYNRLERRNRTPGEYVGAKALVSFAT